MRYTPLTHNRQNPDRQGRLSKYAQYCVGEAYDGVRLDKFLHRKLLIPQGLAQKLLRKGLILVSGNRAMAAHRLALGDIILFERSLELGAGAFCGALNRVVSSTEREEYEKLAKSIVLFEDGRVLVVNKPYGIYSQGGAGIALSIDGLARFLSQGSDEEDCIRLAHRLDQHTSGVMVLAKGYAASREIGDMFRRGLVKKVYYAALCGMPRDEAGVIRSTGEEAFSKNVNKQAAALEPEITEYKVLLRNSRDNNSIVALYPKTGKKHQLRRHMLLLGHPILGDLKYGNKPGIAGKLCLYSHSIDMPGFGKFTAAPPPHMRFIKNLLL